MRKTWKKMASLFLSVLLVLSMVVTPAMAAEGTTRSGSKDAPTEVKTCEASGFWTVVLNLGFDDTTWMNANG